jgi:hypothetical protein
LIEPRGWLGLVEFGSAWAIPAGAGLGWVLLSGSHKARAAAIALSFVRSRRSKPCVKSANPVDVG